MTATLLGVSAAVPSATTATLLGVSARSAPAVPATATLLGVSATAGAAPTVAATLLGVSATAPAPSSVKATLLGVTAEGAASGPRIVVTRGGQWVTGNAYATRAGQWVPATVEVLTHPPVVDYLGREPIQVNSPTDPRLDTPPGMEWVTWQQAWTDAGYTLNHVVDNLLTSEQGLYLPERVEPYDIDLSRGFGAPEGSVSAVAGWTHYQPYARGWFTNLRLRRGLCGGGPGTRLRIINPGGWSAPQQPEKDPGTGERQWYYLTAGGAKVYFSSSEMCVLQLSHDSGYFGNVVVEPAISLGGVAFSFFSATRSSGHIVVRNVRAHGAWHGFKGSPPGETGFIGTATATYDIRRVWADGLNPTGATTGCSPIMINSASSGVVEDVTAINTVAGMCTWWNCDGAHTVTRLDTANCKGASVNLEAPRGQFTLDVSGGSWLRPGSRFHVNLGSYPPAGTSTTYQVIVNATNLDWDRVATVKPGQFCVQVYGDGTHPTVQLASNIHVTNNGAQQPIFFAN